MKAGAFGRQPERRPVQPGGRVLPGMFSSPSPSPSPTPAATTPTTSSTSRPAPTSTSASQPKLANPSGTLLSSWGTGGRGSGRLPGTTAPSRLERLAAESRTTDGDGGDAPSRGGTAASIPRARKLGLNRRARTPSPPSSPEYSPERSPPRSPSPRRRARADAQAAPPSRWPDRERSASPPSTRARRASSPPPVAVAVPTSAADEAEQPQGILSSLWGRATQLVGGSAAGQQPSVVREVGHNRANSVDSSLPVPPSHVTPFQLDHDGHPGADDEHEAHAPPMRKEASTLRTSRPIALPPLVAPARTLTTSSHPAARRISAPPGLARAASEPLPPVEPITYHRPPPLHPRTSALGVGAGVGAQRQRSGASSPYDWLESRDEAPLEPFLFTRALGRAATRRGGRAAGRPAIPQGAATEPGPRAGQERAVGAGAGAAAVVGGMVVGSSAHAHAHASIPPLAPPAFAYAPPPVHPGAPPARPPGAAPPLVASAFTPARPPPELAPAPAPSLPAPPPLAAPIHAWSSSATAPPLVAAAPPLVAQAPTSYGAPYAAPPEHVHEPHEPAEASEPAEAPPAEPLPSYEPRVAPADEAETRDEVLHARQYGAPAPPTEEEALPRSGTGPDSLPIYPSPSSGTSHPPPVSAPPPVAAPAHASSSAAPYSQASYTQAPPVPSAYSQGPYPQPSYTAASQPPPAPPLVPPAALVPTSQPYWPASAAPPMPQYVATSAPGSSAFGAEPAPATATSGDEHYAAHFGTAGPSLSSVLPRLFAATLPAPGPRPSATSAPPGHAVPSAPAATSAASSTASSGHGDLPAGPPILPVTPPPGPPTSSPASAPAPPSQSLYPTHLASVQQQRPQGALGQTSWGALGPPVLSPASPVPTFTRLPTPAAPSPAPTSSISPSPTPVTASLSMLVEPHLLEGRREVEEDLPSYEAPSAESLASAATSSEKEALSLPPHSALETPLPPSPAPPSPLPVQPATSSAVDDLPPPVPARPSSLLVDTTTTTAPRPPASSSAPTSTAPGSSQIVLIPPTPLEPRFASPTPNAVQVDDERLHTSPTSAPPEVEPAPAPVPLPALQPLELGFTLDELGLSTLDFGLGVSDEVVVGEGETGEKEALPWPERASSPAVQFGEDEDDALSGEEPAAADRSDENDLDEAFDAATSFATSFAQADLSRARVDPGHSARTDRWLEQQGVERKPVGELRVVGPAAASGAEASVEEQIVAPGFYRPRTAPPASIAPSLLLPRAYTPAALHAPSTSSSYASSAPHARTTSFSYSPQLAYLSTLRESSTDADEPASPLETSIGMQDSNVLQRTRAVSVDEVARREEIDRATVQSSSTTGAARAALSDAAFAASPGREEVQGGAAVDEKGKGRAHEVKDEPLTGEKGETTDEMAAMFANW
ncbi:hypothetical protein JCM8208_006483 [Rhodotorula glutinis]